MQRLLNTRRVLKRYAQNTDKQTNKQRLARFPTRHRCLPRRVRKVLANSVLFWQQMRPRIFCTHFFFFFFPWHTGRTTDRLVNVLRHTSQGFSRPHVWTRWGLFFQICIHSASPHLKPRIFSVSAITRDVMSCTSNHALAASCWLWLEAAAHFYLGVRLKLLVGESQIRLFLSLGTHR